MNYLILYFLQKQFNFKLSINFKMKIYNYYKKMKNLIKMNKKKNHIINNKRLILKRIILKQKWNNYKKYYIQRIILKQIN
jgi:hypothetical protein